MCVCLFLCLFSRAKKSHKRAHYRTTAYVSKKYKVNERPIHISDPLHHTCFSFSLAAPRETWPKMDKPGLSMRMCESKDGSVVVSRVCQTESNKMAN